MLYSGLHYTHINVPQAHMAVKEKYCDLGIFSLWHDRLGHPGSTMMKRIVENTHGHPLKDQKFPKIDKVPPCTSCSLRKLIARPSQLKVENESPMYLERIQVIYMAQFIHHVDVTPSKSDYAAEQAPTVQKFQNLSEITNLPFITSAAVGAGYPTISIRARLASVVVDGVPSVRTLFRLGRRYEKGGIVAIVEGEAHSGLGLRGGLLGVQTQSHIGRIIISKLTYKFGGLLLLPQIGFRMEPQLGLYAILGEMLGVGYPAGKLEEVGNESLYGDTRTMLKLLRPFQASLSVDAMLHRSSEQGCERESKYSLWKYDEPAEANLASFSSTTQQDKQDSSSSNDPPPCFRGGRCHP
ncbi:retrovirus-related pol polyprotein from transposon TNT 1-94 [Tanacetum coccineum]